MNWQEVKSPEHRGLTVWFTNDQPMTDFSISEYKGRCRLALHTATKRDGEFLAVVFKTLDEAKAYVEEISKTENNSSRLVDFLLHAIDSSASARAAM